MAVCRLLFCVIWLLLFQVECRPDDVNISTREVPLDLAEKIEAITTSILDDLDVLNSLHSKQYTDYVPETDCRSLRQCLGETEVEE